jgi:hypothetical protein
VLKGDAVKRHASLSYRTRVVTLVGWFVVLGGLGRMFFPEAAQQATPSGSVVLAVHMVLLAIGIVLTFNAFRN